MGAGQARTPSRAPGDDSASYSNVPQTQGVASTHAAPIDFRDFGGDDTQSPFLFAILDPLIRTESVDVNNDPRIMSDSVIAHRLSGFSTVVVAAMLLCSLAFSAVLATAPGLHDKFNWLKLVGQVGMLITVCLNLFCTVVVIQQMYLVNRIATSGSMGFEMSKSLYLSKTYVTIRHLGISCFYKSIPLFLGSTAVMVWDQVSPRNNALICAMVLVVGLGFVMALTCYVHFLQRTVFHEKLQKMQQFETPMRNHVEFEISGHVARQGGGSVDGVTLQGGTYNSLFRAD